MPRSETDWGIAIKHAESVRDEKLRQVDKYYKMYQDIFEELTEVEAAHRVTVNLVFSNVNTMLPNLYFQNPHIRVHPLKPVVNIVDAEGLPLLPDYILMERILNDKIEKLEYDETERLTIIDALISGTGITKFGYSRVFEHDETRGEDLIVEDDIWAQRVIPKRFLIDPLATISEEARWMGEEIPLPWTEVKKLFGEKKIEKLGLSPTHIFDGSKFIGIQEVDSSSISTSSMENAVLKIFEIWDKVEKKVRVFADGKESGELAATLDETDWPYPEIKGYPYELLVYHVDPGSPWGLSWVRPWEAQQRELNFHRSKLAMRHAKSKVIFAILAGSIDDDELQAIEEGDDFVIAKFKTLPDRAAKLIQGSVFDNEAAIMNSIILDDIDRISGISESARGQISGGRTTASEVAEVARSSNIRSADMRKITEKHIRRVWSKLAKIFQSNVEGTQHAKYFDEKQEKPVAVAFTNKDIKGAYDVSIEVGSTQIPNKEVRQSLLLQLSQLLVNNPNINQVEYLRQLLKEFDFNIPGLAVEAPEVPIDESKKSTLKLPTGRGAQESAVGEPTTAGIQRVVGGTNRP